MKSRELPILGRARFLALMALLTPTLAGAATWDANGKSSTQIDNGLTEGSGSWLGTNQWWFPGNGDWGNGGHDASFGNGGTGTGGNVSLAGSTAVSSISFGNYSGTYTLSGGSITLNGGIQVNPTAGNATFSLGIELGSVLTSFSNASGSSLNMGAITGSAASVTQTIDIGSSSSGNISLGAVIADGIAGGKVALAINNTSTGATNISGNNTFTGGVTLDGGTLNLRHSKALGNGGTFNINSGTINNTTSSALVVTGPTMSLDGDFAYGTATGTTNNNLTLSGPVLAPANRTITLNGAGALGFSGTLTNTSDSVRTLTVNNGTGTTATSKLTIGNYNLTGPGSSGPRNNIINGTGNVAISGVVDDGVSPLSGLTYGGSGSLALSGASTFTGGVTLNSGILSINSVGVFGSNGPLGIDGTLTINGGTLTTSGTRVVLHLNPINLTVDLNYGTPTGTGNLTLPGDVNLGGSNREIICDGTGTLGLSGRISNGSIIKEGPGGLSLSGPNDFAGGIILNAGTLTLSGASTFTGGVTLNAGTLNINSVGVAGVSGPLGNGGPLIINGGTINNTSGSVVVVEHENPIHAREDFTYGSTIYLGSRDLTLPGAVNLDGEVRTITVDGYATGSPTFTLSGIVSNGGLIKDGIGALKLSNPANDYTGGTVINGGILLVTDDGCLGASSGGVTFNGTAQLINPDGYVVTCNPNRTFTLNPEAEAILHPWWRGTLTIQGKVTGAGSLVIDATIYAGVVLSSSNNDFTGGIIIGGTSFSMGLDIASISDVVGVGIVKLGGARGGEGGVLRWIGGSGATKTLFNRQFALNGTTGGGQILADGATSADNLVIQRDLLITAVGNKSLTLGGNNLGANTFAGNIADGTGSVIGVTKSGGGTWILTGTNTYSGATTMNVGSGLLVIQGQQALSPNTTVILSQSSTPSSHLSLKMNGTGTISLPNTLTINHQNTVLGINITVGNNGSGTGNTIAFNKLNVAGLNNGQGRVGIGSVNSNNDYRLRFNNFDLPAFGFTSLATWTFAFQGNTAPLTLAGTIQQVAGTTGFSAQSVLELNSFTTGNLVPGDIKDAADFLTNAITKPLRVTVNPSYSGRGSTGGEWTLSGNNTFSGGLTLSGQYSGSQLNVNSATALGTGTFTISGGNNAKFDNTSGSPITLTANHAQTWSNDFAFVGSNDLNMGTGAVSMGATRTVTVASGILTVGGSISGSGFGLTKAGNGTLALGGTNVYTGTTTINGGMLTLGVDDALSDSSNVVIGNGILKLSNSVNDTVGTLDVTNAASTINLGTGATLAFAISSAVDWTAGTLNITGAFVSGSSIRFGTNSSGLTSGQLALIRVNGGGAGTFSLNANGYLTTTQTPYETWANGAAFIADSNGDGVKNGLAWLLGAANKDINASALLPVPSENTAKLVMTFDCLSAANRGNAVLAVQYSNDLGITDPWTSHQAAVPGAVGTFTVSGVNFTATANGALIHVVAEIPTGGASGGKLFGRLNAVITP